MIKPTKNLDPHTIWKVPDDPHVMAQIKILQASDYIVSGAPGKTTVYDETVEATFILLSLERWPELKNLR